MLLQLVSEEQKLTYSMWQRISYLCKTKILYGGGELKMRTVGDIYSTCALQVESTSILCSTSNSRNECEQS